MEAFEAEDKLLPVDVDHECFPEPILNKAHSTILN